MPKIRLVFQVNIIYPKAQISEIPKLVERAKGFIASTITANKDSLDFVRWEIVKEEPVEEKAK